MQHGYKTKRTERAVYKSQSIFVGLFWPFLAFTPFSTTLTLCTQKSGSIGKWIYICIKWSDSLTQTPYYSTTCFPPAPINPSNFQDFINSGL